MLIDAHNKVSGRYIYNLHNSISLSHAVLKGLDAFQIHNLVMEYEQMGIGDKIEYTSWFTWTYPLQAEMLTKEQLAEIISESVDKIAYKTLENPFEFKEIYERYVVPMVILQKDM